MKTGDLYSARFYKHAGLVLSLGFLTAIATPFVAVADGGDHGHHRGGMMSLEKAEKMAMKRMQYLAKMVDANPEQKEQLRTIAKSSVEQSQPLRVKQIELRKQKMQLLAVPQIDVPAVNKLNQELQTNQNALHDILNQAQLDTAQALAPEQRVKLMQRMQKHGKGDKHKREYEETEAS